MKKFGENGNSHHLATSGGGVVSFLTEIASLFIFTYSPKSRSLISWSGNAEKVLGVKDVDIAREGNVFLRYVHSDDRFLLLNELENTLKGKSSYRATYRWIRPDTKELRWLHCRAALKVIEDTNNIEAEREAVLEGIIVDLSDELSGQGGKLEGPDSVSAILEALPTIVFTLDKDLRLLRLSHVKEAHAFNFGDEKFRHDEFKVGKLFLPCFSSVESESQYRKNLSDILEDKIQHVRSRISIDETTFSLEMLPLRDKDSIIGVLGVISDISDLVHLEKDLSELQKSDSLRLLAAGVAHHFNNALQSIMGQAAVINSHPENSQLVQQASSSILDVVNRVSNLTRQLFVLETSERNSLTPVDVNLAAMTALNRVSDMFGTGVKVAVSFGNPAPVMAKHEELAGAFAAILRNSAESMGGRGVISIKTYETQLREGEVQDLKGGRFAKIIISDSGSGMTEETKRRCFEPFFTTKERDPETGVSLTAKGLGLSKAFAIAREFGGTIICESETGTGTSVVIYLPVKESSHSEAMKTEEHSPLLEKPQILIVDDDHMVLETVTLLLRDMGYRCVSAEDPRRALNLARAHNKTLELVLLDALMPGMDGISVLRKLRRIAPHLSIIGFSGATAEQTRPLLEAGALEILRKPVDPKTLADAVRGVMMRQRAAVG